MVTRMFDTNTAEVTKPLAEEVLKQIEVLKRATADLERAVKDHDSKKAIPYGWIHNMQEPFESIKANVCRINGAVLVRANDAEQQGPHPSHKTRSSDASSFDEICVNCGATDNPHGKDNPKWAQPCPHPDGPAKWAIPPENDVPSS
jgi:hypothetical protein